MAAAAMKKGVTAMIEIICPWCEATLRLGFADEAVEQTCPECQTSWTYEDVPAVELPAAA
jgi:uncharacterized Zn-finger protein